MTRRGPGRPPLGKKALSVAERQRRYRQRHGLSNSAIRGVTDVSDAQMNDAMELDRRPRPPPLPQTKADLLAGYKLKRKRSINDLVEEIVVKLWDQDDDFMKYVDAIYDSDAVEGSLAEDDTIASQIIRNYAGKHNHVEVAGKNLHTIKLAMKVALRRFGVDRPEREEKAVQLLPPTSPPSEAAE
jgi:hypothetical protein